MTQYHPFKVYLSDAQKNKLERAHKNNESIGLRIVKTKTPNQDLKLTNTQINHINKAVQGCNITLSKSQMKQNGGIISPTFPFPIPPYMQAASGQDGGFLSIIDIIKNILGGNLKKVNIKQNGGKILVTPKHPQDGGFLQFLLPVLKGIGGIAVGKIVDKILGNGIWIQQKPIGSGCAKMAQAKRCLKKKNL